MDFKKLFKKMSSSDSYTDLNNINNFTYYR